MQILNVLHTSPAAAGAMFVTFYLAMCALAGQLVQKSWISGAVTSTGGRYGTIDGLRGVLAYGVMCHHSVTAYFYFLTGIWSWSTNPVLNNLGQTTVALFFMITGFLFTRQCTKGSVDWKKLYISRVARLLPLYSVAVMCVFIIIFALSNFKLRVSLTEIFEQFAQWISFVCFGRPDINGVQASWTVIAGVNWSLKYEVGFYVFGLPLIYGLSHILGRRIFLLGTLAAFFLSVALVAWRGHIHGTPLYIVHFLAGSASVKIWEEPLLRRFIASGIFRLIAILAILVFGFAIDGTSAVALIAAMVIFLAALGNCTFFGVLSSRASIWLGDISYGIYLFHGMAIWLSLFALRNAGLLQKMDSPIFFLVLIIWGSGVMAIASVLHIFLEKPMIEAGRKIANSSSRLVIARSRGAGSD